MSGVGGDQFDRLAGEEPRPDGVETGRTRLTAGSNGETATQFQTDRRVGSQGVSDHKLENCIDLYAGETVGGGIRVARRRKTGSMSASSAVAGGTYAGAGFVEKTA